MAATRQVVTDYCLVVRIKRVGVLSFDHDAIGLQQSLHAGLQFSFFLGVELFDSLLIQASKQTHQFFISFDCVLVALAKGLLVRG